MEIINIGNLYSFHVTDTNVLSGEFVNLKFTQMLGFIDALKRDSTLPELMKILGYDNPADYTYLVFTRGDEEIVLCKEWIVPSSVVTGDNLVDLTLTIPNISTDLKQVILNWLTSMNITYRVG